MDAKAFLVAFILTVAALPAHPEQGEAPAGLPFYPDVPLMQTVSEERREICPGLTHIHRVTADPMNINVLLVDLTVPGVSLRTGLSNDVVAGVETVRSIADRHGATAAINGDYWGPNGIEQGLTVVDGEIVMAPKARSAFAVLKDGRAVIDRFTDQWTWQARVIAPDGSEHPITLMNSEVRDDWLCLYTSRFGLPTPGRTASPVTEVFLTPSGLVADIVTDGPPRRIPRDGRVLVGRGKAGEWLRRNARLWQVMRLDLRSTRLLDDVWQAIGAGPLILKDGEFHQDSLKPFPDGEEFTPDWKKEHYLLRQPRSAVGVSEDGRKVVLITVDGRQPDFSLGIYQKQMADLMLEFGASDAMDLDSGGSATMVIEGKVVNHPSDGANPDGTGGRERAVANALLVFCGRAANGGP